MVESPAVVRRVMRTLGGQTVVAAGATGVGQIVVAAVYALSARGAGPAEYGLVVSALALGSSVVGIVDFGSTSLWTRDLARGTSSTREVSELAATKLAVMLVGALAGVLVCMGVPPITRYWVAAPVAATILADFTMQVPLRSLARNDLVAIGVLTNRLVLALVFALTFVVGASSVHWLWLALSLGSLSSAALCRALTPAASRLRLTTIRRVNPWRGSAHYGTAGLAITTQSLDLPVLEWVAGAHAAGTYGAVNRWTQPMGLLATAFSGAMVPFVARMSSPLQALRSVRSALWILALAVLACLGVAVAAPWLVDLLVGPAYRGSAAVLTLLALATVPAVLNQPIYAFLQSSGQDRPVSFTTAAAVAAQFAAIIALGPRFGALGAAIGAVVVQLLLLAGLGALLWRTLSADRAAAGSVS